jgi:SAM-dependent methyltransferase
MIIHKLIAHHLGHRDDAEFYRLQARDALHWLERQGVSITATTRVLDLGCGHGVFGFELEQRGCPTVYADTADLLLPAISRNRFRSFAIGRDDPSVLGRFDLVLFSNVLEHLAAPADFLCSASALLVEGGHLFLSWTNWLSPWGGHEFSPFHYLGARRGPRVYDWLARKPRLHTPFVNLFPTYIGTVLAQLRSHPQLEIRAVAPRYYPELAWITRVPILREFATWNCSVLLRRRAGDAGCAPLEPRGRERA